MKSASINLEKLQELIETLRQSNLPAKERRSICDQILLSLDIIKQTEQENLLCIKHAMESRDYANHSTIYRSAQRGNLHTFRICCRDFFDRKEIEALGKKGPRGRQKKVRVGMS